MSVTIHEEDFDPWERLRLLSRLWDEGRAGALASFIGVARADEADGVAVSAIVLEHYAGMTERVLGELEDEAARRWGLLATCVEHRVGRVEAGCPIVLVGVLSERRSDAFAACRFLVEELKSRAPFWKCEERTDGTRHWVEGNN